MSRLHLLVAFLVLAAVPRGYAAELLVVPGQPILYIMGEISLEDERRAVELIDGHGVETVAMSGPGGSLEGAYRLGEIILDRGLSTTVIQGEDCASACAIIFLSGTSRTLPEGSRLGFHLPFIPISVLPSPVEEDDPLNFALMRATQESRERANNYCTDLLIDVVPGLIRMTSDRVAAPAECLETTYQLGFADAYRMTLWVQRSGADPRLLSLIASTPPHQMRWILPDEAQALGVTTP